MTIVVCVMSDHHHDPVVGCALKPKSSSFIIIMAGYKLGQEPVKEPTGLTGTS